MTQKVLTYEDLQITLADVYEQMGYHGALPDEATQQETQAVVDEVRQWLRPQYCFFVVRELPAFNMGKIILRQLRGSEAYALFVCTAGVEYEAYQQRLKTEGDMVRVFIADALGSVIAEKCADQMEVTLQESIDKRLARQRATTPLPLVRRTYLWHHVDGLVADGAHQERQRHHGLGKRSPQA